MEGVTAWFRAQGKEVTIMSATVYVSAALNLEMSLVTCLVDAPHANVTTKTIREQEEVRQNVQEVASHSGGPVNNPTISDLTVQPLEGEPLAENEIQVPTSVLL